MGSALGCRRRRQGEVVLLLVGPEAAGKSRTAAALAGERAPSGATVGFRPRGLRHRGRRVRLHDVGGGDGFRGAWPHYFRDAHGLLFVLDAADVPRLPLAARLLAEVLAHPCVSGKPILILANKQDLDGAMDDLDIVEKLNIEDLVNKYKCPTRVEAYSNTVPNASTKPYIDPGLKKGYEWLLNYIIHKYDDIDLRVQADINKEAENRLAAIKESQSNHTETTGFENPNYSIENNETQSGNSIIVVQHNVSNNKNVKLSPLFGKSNTSEPIKSTVELETRPHMRKLSPIVRKRIYPMSSRESILLENSERKRGSVDAVSTANEIFANQLREFKSRENLREDVLDAEVRMPSSVTVSRTRITEVSLADNNISPMFTSVLKSESNKRILPPITLDNDNIKMVTPKQINNLMTNDETVDDVIVIDETIDLKSVNERYMNDDRPKSASEMIRKQLESANISNHKGKIIKGFRKNRTTPEDNTSMFMFDPEISQDSNKYGSADNPESQSDVVVHPSL